MNEGEEVNGSPRYRARYDGAPIRDTREQAHQNACDYYVPTGRYRA